MSLLALLADNFELEPHHDDEHMNRSVTAMNISIDNDLAANIDIGDKGDRLDEPLLLDGAEAVEKKDAKNTDDEKLLLSFFLMVAVGTLNKIFQKLQAIVSAVLLS